MNVNGIDLHVADEGDGPLVVLVHGSWTDHAAWGAVQMALAASGHRVVSYDRRGHSRSEGPAGARLLDEADLVALIEALSAGPAFVVGSSLGALIAISAAGRRPDLISGLCVHEPPCAALDPHAVAAALATMDQVIAMIADGDHEAAAQRFVEEAVLGPGAWQMLPPPVRATMTGNAEAFRAQAANAGWLDVDPAAGRRFEGPLMLTKGDASPAWLPLLTVRLYDRLPNASLATIVGAGHAPHLTHPGALVDLVRRTAALPVRRAA